MTFEEFIFKKKIDLAQFKIAEPGLFSEFQSHYSQMGEKSFDHSKKFLFNKIRRAYHLKEEPKPILAKETIPINEIASQAEPLISPTIEATVYTPRFRAKVTLPPTEENIATPAEQTKPAFKPRFKPGLTGTAETKPAESTQAESPEENPKPAYVPRFKAASPAKPVEESKEEVPEIKPKPAYIPRFKAPVIPKPEEGKIDEDTNGKV